MKLFAIACMVRAMANGLPDSSVTLKVVASKEPSDATAPPLPTSVTLINGVTMPLVSVGAGGGAAFAPLSRANPGEIKSTVTSALQQGYRAVDTAYDYQCCAPAVLPSKCGKGGEQCASGVSQAISGYDRSALFLTTKVPGCGVNGDGGAPATTACYADTLSTAQKDLVKLGIKVADLTLLHFPPNGGCSTMEGCQRAQQQWAALEVLYKQGKARAIGVSDYCQDCLTCLAKNSTVTPMVNRVQHHIGMGPDPTGLHTYCAKRNIQIVAYGVLAAGGGPFPSAGQGREVKAIGAAHGKSGYQVALRWIVQRGIPIIVRAASGKHFAQDMDILDWELTDAEMSRLDGVTGPNCAHRRWPNAPEKCCMGAIAQTQEEINAFSPQSIDDVAGKLIGSNEAMIGMTEKHEDITVIDLCTIDAMDSCIAQSRMLLFPTVTSTPTYSWNVTAKLPGDITTPTYDVKVAFQENLPRPFHYQIPLGHDSGAACGTVQVRFGVGSKGDRSPLPCPGCHIALTFPECPSGWKEGALLVEGEFKMGFFLIPGYEPTPNITVNVTVRSNGGRVFDLTSHQRPKRGPASVIV